MAPRQYGVVLTHVRDMDELRRCVIGGGYDALKVVSQWGIVDGWNLERRQQLLALAPHVIVRTVTGDPSAGNHDPANRLPNPDTVEAELKDWYALKPEIMFEIGNEPNIDDNPTDEFIWNYRFQLEACLKRARQVFPNAKLIAPGLIIGPTKRFERFNEIAADVFRAFDYIGLHVYEHFGFNHENPAQTGQLRDALAVAMHYYPDHPWYVTEFGINDTAAVSPAEKGRRYAAMAFFGGSDPPLPRNVRGMVYYHLATNNDLNPSYQIFPDGDTNFRACCVPHPPELAPFNSDVWNGIELPNLTQPPFSISSDIRDN